MSLFLAVGAMAQEPVVEVGKVGTMTANTVPYVLSTTDADKIFALENLTVVVKVKTNRTMSGRGVLVCAADPTKNTVTEATPKNSPYVAYGVNGLDVGYLASSKEGDRFTKAALQTNKEFILVYVVDVQNNLFKVYCDGVEIMNRNFGSYEIASFKMVKDDYPDAKIYLGAGVTANQNDIEYFDGTIQAMHFYDCALTPEKIRVASARINGKYVRVRRYNDKDSYMVSDGNNGYRASFSKSAENNKTIMYYNNEKSLLSYYNGLYFASANGDRLSYTNAIGTKTAACIQKFDENSYVVEMCTNNRFLYSANSNGQIDGGNFPDGVSAINNDNYKFVVEDVASLPIIITDANYATFFAPVEVTVPVGVEVYYATAEGIDGGYISLTKIENGVVPANTGVILYAENGGTYNLDITTTGAAAITDNLLRGTVAATYVAEDAYVLAKDANNEAYFGKATKNQQNGASWLNNSHKAYLPASLANGAASYSFRFEGEGTTAIENVEVENEVKAIYDLTGRRVESITAPGIYIVGGKKILVK